MASKLIANRRLASGPKCPHCGSKDYGLMPSDFETAKCNECGKNWNHGIMKGINDPKVALKDTHGAEAGLRMHGDYGAADTSTAKANALAESGKAAAAAVRSNTIADFISYLTSIGFEDISTTDFWSHYQLGYFVCSFRLTNHTVHWQLRRNGEVVGMDEGPNSLQDLKKAISKFSEISKTSAELVKSDDQVIPKAEEPSASEAPTPSEIPVLPGPVVPTEPPNQNAMREVMETQQETEVGMPVQEKAVELAEEKEQENKAVLTTQDGKTIHLTINIASKTAGELKNIGDASVTKDGLETIGTIVDLRPGRNGQDFAKMTDAYGRPSTMMLPGGQYSVGDIVRGRRVSLSEDAELNSPQDTLGKNQEPGKVLTMPRRAAEDVLNDELEEAKTRAEQAGYIWQGLYNQDEDGPVYRMKRGPDLEGKPEYLYLEAPAENPDRETQNRLRGKNPAPSLVWYTESENQRGGPYGEDSQSLDQFLFPPEDEGFDEAEADDWDWNDPDAYQIADEFHTEEDARVKSNEIIRRIEDEPLGFQNACAEGMANDGRAREDGEDYLNQVMRRLKVPHDETWDLVEKTLLEHFAEQLNATAEPTKLPPEQQEIGFTPQEVREFQNAAIQIWNNIGMDVFQGMRDDTFGDSKSWLRGREVADMVADFIGDRFHGGDLDPAIYKKYQQLSEAQKDYLWNSIFPFNDKFSD